MSEKNTKKMTVDLEKVSWIPFIFSGLVLILYPAILLASVMSLGGNVGADEPLGLLIIAKSFLWGSLLYPFIYFFCLIAFFVSKKRGKKKLWRVVPYLYFIACCMLLALWSAIIQ